MQNLIFKFESGWDFSLALVLGPVGLVIGVFFPHFRNIWRESKKSGVVVALRAGLKKLSWFGCCLLFVIIGFWALNVGVHRTFTGILVGNQLILDYPWPRSDAIISWPDVVKVGLETNALALQKQLGFNSRW